MHPLLKKINFGFDTTQGSTQRNLIVIPVTFVGIVLLCLGNIEAGVAVIGAAQFLANLLGAVVSDTPVK